MQLFFKHAAIATVLSLSLAPIAKAGPSDYGVPLTKQPTQVAAPQLVAQASQVKSTLPPRAQMLLELLGQHMAMRKMAMEAMKSPDPEMQKIGQETAKRSEDEILKLIKMMRAEFLANPDR